MRARRSAQSASASRSSWAAAAARIVSRAGQLQDGRQATLRVVSARRRRPGAGFRVHHTALGGSCGTRNDARSTTVRALRRHASGRYGSGARAAFWPWWRQALASWLPARWRVLLGLAQDRLLLSARPATSCGCTGSDGDGLRDLVRLPLPLQETASWTTTARSCWPRVRRTAALAAAAGGRRSCGAACCCRPPPPNACATWSGSRSTGRRRSPPATVRFDARVFAAPAGRPAGGRTGRRAAAGASMQRWPRWARLPASLAGVDMAGDATAGRSGVNLLPLAAAPSPRTIRWRDLEPGAGRGRGARAGAWRCGRCWTTAAQAADAFAAEVEGARAGSARVAAEQRQRLVDLVEGTAFLRPHPRQRGRPRWK